ncbi:MAG: TonB-dependent receptor domain-containing protein [Bacteroidales bacterium]
MRSVLFGLILVFLASGVYAQPGGGQGPTEGKAGSIQGEVFVEDDGPLEYANITLYKKGDSSLVTGTVTDADGNFELDKVPFGRFYLEVDFIGFRKKIIPDIAINPKNSNEKLGTLYLQETTQDIEDVEVTANRPQVTYKVDKKVINVDEDYSAEGGSAVRVLENVPSIQVDIEGNVELRGSSNFRVLIDGKPSPLDDGSEALQSIPAGMIENIEIITNPSVKYDPEGTAGIINVIMKEGRQAGLNGRVKASVATNNAYDANANLNYRLNDKINLITNLSYRDFNFDMEGISERINFSGDTTSYIDQIMDNTMGRGGYSFEGGIEYNFSENSSLSVTGDVGSFGFKRGGTTHTKSYTDPNTNRNFELTSNESDMTRNYHNVNLDYQNNFDKDNHELSASLYLRGGDHEDINKREEYLTDSEWNKISNDPFRQREEETSSGNQVRAKLDYTWPLSGGGKLETGYQGRYHTRNQDYRLQKYHKEQWVTDEAFTNDADHSRMIQALYGTYSDKLLGIEYQLGMRGEYTNRFLDQQTMNETFRIERFDLFPSVHLTKRFSKKDQLFASYSRRIRRPRGWFIDPFRTYMDQYNVRQGNPELEPEYTDSYEMGYKKTFGSSFATLETYYRKTNNEISRIQKPGEGNLMIHTFDNISQEHSMGMELSLNTSIYKWWNLNVSGNFFLYSIDDEEILGENISRSSNNWSANLNNTFRLPTGTSIQIMARYRSPSVTAQGQREGFLMTNLGIRHSFLEDKLTLNVSGRDLLQSMNREVTSSGPGFETYRFMEREAPIVNFSVSYTINNYERDRRRDEEAPDEEFEGGEQQMY